MQNGTTTIYGGEVDNQWELAGDLGVESVAVTAGGSGYTSAPTVAFTSVRGSGAAGTAVLTNGVVTSVIITDPGSGYVSAPYVSFTGGGGTGAEATANVALGVASVAVTEKGSGYTSVPTVVFTGGGGSGAAGTAVLTNGVVTSVNITNPGSGYVSAPAVSFTGGGGTGAMATATITPSVGQMTITNQNGNVYDAASQQYVSYLNFTTPTTPLTIALGNGSSSITLDAITGVPEVNVQGGAGGNNTLIGSQDASHTWDITGTNTGTVSGYGSTAVAFSNVGVLIGGNQNDTFVYAQGASENGVDGGGGTETLDSSTVVYKASATAPNTPNSIVFASSDDFVSGEQVTYVSTLAASADTSGLTPNSIYFVNVINPTTIQLSLKSGGIPVSLGTSALANGTSPWTNGTDLLQPVKTLDYRADGNASVTLGMGNVDINNVKGDDSVTNNTLVGVADDNVWTISGQNSGTVVTPRHVTTALNANTVVNTATGTPSGPTPTLNSIVFPVSDGFVQGEQVTYVSTVSTLHTLNNVTQLSNNAAGGVFTITATVNSNPETTGLIPWNAAANDVQAALNSLPGVNVTVTGSGAAGSPWSIMGLSSGVTLTTDDSLLTPSSSVGSMDASGLTPNAKYYVNVIDPYTIQLGLSAPSAGTTFNPVPLTGDPWANGNNELVHAPVLISSVSFSGFQNLAANGGNDQFVLEDGMGVDGTIDGGTGMSSIDYSAYSTPVTVDLRSASLSTTIVDPASATSPNTPNSITFVNADGFTQGEEVTYVSNLGAADTSGLTSGTPYYVNVVNSQTIQLSSTPDEDNIVPLGANPWAAGTNMLKPTGATTTGTGAVGGIDDFQSVIAKHSAALNAATIVYPATATTPNTPNSIAFGSADGFYQGEQVTYASTLGAADTSGLTSGRTYYVNVIDQNTIQLGLSAPSAGATFTPVPLHGAPGPAAPTCWNLPAPRSIP